VDICCTGVSGLRCSREREKYEISRRALVGSLATGAILPTTAVTSEGSTDARLLDLGHQFDELVQDFDNATDDLFVRLQRVEAEILSTPARSFDGYRVKARAACWALLGDIEPHSGATTDQRMALSIVRDLIQQFDPDLEHPGALKKLVADLV
jgi:hypothetical protein